MTRSRGMKVIQAGPQVSKSFGDKGHVAMKPVTSLLLAVEAGAAIALVGAAVLGDTTLHSNGLHVSKLAYDNIAFTILAVCIVSCGLAAILLARVAKSWDRVEALGFLAAVLLGWLAASAYANARGSVTLNGA